MDISTVFTTFRIWATVMAQAEGLRPTDYGIQLNPDGRGDAISVITYEAYFDFENLDDAAAIMLKMIKEHTTSDA